jgi:hypothetical protein
MGYFVWRAHALHGVRAFSDPFRRALILKQMRANIDLDSSVISAGPGQD